MSKPPSRRFAVTVDQFPAVGCPHRLLPARQRHQVVTGHCRQVHPGAFELASR